MGWITGTAVYFVIWWLTLFMILPIGVQRQEDGGKLVYVVASDMEFDRTYQGNYGELARALWWVIQTNFGQVLKRVPFGGGG